MLRLAALALPLLAGAGCGGFSASHSISPATFLLPGLVQSQPAPEPVSPPPAAEVGFRSLAPPAPGPLASAR